MRIRACQEAASANCVGADGRFVVRLSQLMRLCPAPSQSAADGRLWKAEVIVFSPADRWNSLRAGFTEQGWTQRGRTGRRARSHLMAAAAGPPPLNPNERGGRITGDIAAPRCRPDAVMKWARASPLIEQ